MANVEKTMRTLETLSNGAELLARKPWSDHPEDTYLEAVLARYHGEYVTWQNNLASGGPGEGHYFNNLLEAMEDYDKRGRTKTGLGAKTRLVQSERGWTYR